jgi:hypothetical protein
MLAQNPTTGAPIKIMRSESSIWRNKKTLLWLKTQATDQPWDRFDTLTVGPEDTQKWLQAKKRVDYVVLPDADEATQSWFLQAEYKSHRMIFVTRKLVATIGEAKFRALGASNVVCIDELHLMYSFLGHEWDTTIEDAILMAAALLRYSILSGVSTKPQQRLNAFKANEISLSYESCKPPKPLYFITQFYKSDRPDRHAEIKKCLEMNTMCPYIDRIVLLNEKDYSKEFPKSKKIQQVIVGKRSTYKIVLEYIKEKVPEGVICVFANADIFLDLQDSWRDIWAVDMVDQFLALLRWDVQRNMESKLFGPRNDSQDTWCVLSDSVKNSKKVWEWSELDFPFGKAGCDNAITVEMMKRKFCVSNPALSLKTHHLQITEYRTYNKMDIVDKPSYLYVDPTGIHDMKPIYDLSKFELKKSVATAFTRPLKAIQPRVLDTYCKMLEREERFKFEKNGTNIVPAEEMTFTRYVNGFHTIEGLTYGYNRLYIGKTDTSKEAWSKSQLSPVVPTIKVKRAFIAPFIDSQADTTEGYLLYYVSKILLLRKEFGDGEFWTAKGDSTKGLELFHWNKANVPVLPRSENAQVWFEEGIQYPWLSTNELRREEVQALRSFMKIEWQPTPTGQTWVIVVDGKYITNEMALVWEEKYTDKLFTCVYEGRTNPQVSIEKMVGAEGVILYGGSKSIARWGYLWALPKTAKVIEIQNEMDPNGDIAHLSGAADLSLNLIIIPRANDVHTRAMIDKHLIKTFDSFTVPESNLPVVRMPRSTLTGFFSHAGDSFREMAKLWEEKGYVRVVEDPKATQIWIGDVLLYDRPTLDWLIAAPEEEQKWKLALFGNPKPSTTGGPASPWFFWPRRPKLVESLVAKPSVERTKTLVFYGKIENKVQERRRMNLNWASVCDDYQMMNGDSTPYKYTQDEYLVKLSESKYGLCLAGFGKKCHREIECMALGTVPIVAADVDMDSYANPPIEGTHYFRCATPEAVKSILESTTDEQRLKMSEACKVWWRDNASAEGSWLLTKKLIGL